MAATNIPSPTQGHVLARFMAGFRYPFAGGRHLVANPRLWSYVVVPTFLTTLMIGGAGWLAWTQGPVILELGWSQPTGEGALAVSALVAWNVALVFLRLVLFLVGTIALYMASSVLAVPFNDFLSQAVEEAVLGSRNEPFTWGLFLSDLRMSLGHSLLGLLVYLLVMLPVLLLNLVPGVGSVLATGIGGIATALFLAREMLDGPLSRDRLPFGVKLEVVKAHKVFMTGFGCATAVLLWVPGLNLLSIPCSVVGGTLLYCRLKRDGELPEPRKRT